MKQVYSHKQLLELRHECQNAEVKQFSFNRRSVSASGPAATPPKLKHNVWASYPVIANHNYAKLPLGLKNRPDRPRKLERSYKLESMTTLMARQIGISELPVGAKIIKAAPGTPIPINAIRVSFDGKFTDENAALPREAVRFRDPDVGQDQYKYGFDEVFWELPDLDAGAPLELTHEYTRSPLVQGVPSPEVVNDGYLIHGHYAPYFEQYIRKQQEKTAVSEADTPDERGRSYDSESYAEDSSDSSNVQIQLPDLQI